MKKVIFDDSEYDEHELQDEDFNALFDNKHDGNKYVVTGYLDLWDGIYSGTIPKVYPSLKEAIIDCSEGFGICSNEIIEENYGRLYVITHHHDALHGGNRQEIRMLSPLGEELYDNGCPVKTIINRKGATKNVKFSKNYL